MNGQINFEEKIKKKFRLFEGVRSQEEDQKLFDKLAGLCLEEAMIFLAENLGEEGMEKLTSELGQVEGEEEKMKKVAEYMGKVENAGLRLSSRLEVFLDNLLLDTLEKKKNG